MNITRIGSEVFFEDVGEGEIIDPDYWTDGEITTIVRMSSSNLSTLIAERQSKRPYIDQYTDPIRFGTNYRMLSTWHFISYYKDVKSEWDMPIPVNDHMYTDKEVEIFNRR